VDEVIEILVSEAIIDDRNAAVTARVGGNAIEHRGIVGAMAAGLHNYRAINSEMRVQRCQHLLWGIGRRIAPVRRIGKFGRRAEHVAMRVTTACRQSEVRFATMRKELGLVHRVALAKRDAPVKVREDRLAPTPPCPLFGWRTL